MKIECNACELAEANVFCCADEAALCWGCDEKVHAANKLATKHQRVPLSASSSCMPKCDICQETIGWFFCLEDRALLCRKCDIAIHIVNTYVSAHQRFLLTGVKVGLDPAEPGPSSSLGRSHSGGKVSERDSSFLSSTRATQSPDGMKLDFQSPSEGNVPQSSNGHYKKAQPDKDNFGGDFAQDKLLSKGSAAGSIPQWQLDEFLGLNDFNPKYGYVDNGYVDNGFSQAGSRKPGESDKSSIPRAGDEELDGDGCLGQVPDASWAVPQIPSSPTASGLYWPETYQNPSGSAAFFVPDVCYLPTQNLNQHKFSSPSFKRRRQL